MWNGWWPSDLAVYHRGMMHILETTRKKTPYAVNMTGIGYRVPMLQTGLGRAWLAFCTDTEREKIIAELHRSENPFDRAARNPKPSPRSSRRRGASATAPAHPASRCAQKARTRPTAWPCRS